MGSRVLLIDDGEADRRFCADALTHAGFAVETAADGPSGLRALYQVHPDVVLLDIVLPGMDGWTTARHIRNTVWGKDAVLVAITGWGRLEDIRRSREAGFDHHLIKPMDPDALLSLLSSARPSAERAADAA